MAVGIHQHVMTSQPICQNGGVTQGFSNFINDIIEYLNPYMAIYTQHAWGCMCSEGGNGLERIRHYNQACYILLYSVD